MDASIETYNRKLTETSMLKQQLENQIALLKEQIHSARMNDEHYANRAQSIERELSEREEQLGTLISDQTRLQAELDSGRKAETLEKENLNKLQIRIASLSSDIEKNQNDIREILDVYKRQDTLRPSLQILKTKPGTKLVSAFFIMVVPDCEMGANGTFLFGDSGLEQNPDPEKLAAIALSSADSFRPVSYTHLCKRKKAHREPFLKYKR